MTDASQLHWVVRVLFATFVLVGGCGASVEPPAAEAPSAPGAVPRLASVSVSPAAPSAQWAQWRGPLATGEAPLADPPTIWSETQNIRWKTVLPGLGHSTPVVWGDRIYVTSAEPDPETITPQASGVPGAHDNLRVTRWWRFVVLAIDRRDGEILWKKTVNRALPHEGGHNSASLASASPVTDGERVYASFGSFGLFCLDPSGEVLWRLDLGDMRTKHAHGEGSSPVLHGETLVVNWDHEGQSFVVALDKRSGKERWRAARSEVTSWASPIVVEHDGRAQVIVSGTQRVRAYDLADGTVIWECGGLSANVVASPVAGDGRVFVASSYDTRALMAIELAGAKGDITGSEQVVWSRRRGTPYVPSPLLYRGDLYFLGHYQGVLSRVVAATGDEPLGPFRLPGVRNIYASPVAAAGRVYVTGRGGRTAVVSHSDTPTVLAINELDDRFSASAALAGRELFLRGEKSLYCIADDSGSVDETIQ